MKRILLVWLALASSVLAQGRKFSWDVHTDTNALGYRLLTGTASGIYTSTNTVAGRLNNTVLVTNKQSGRLFSVLTAFDASGLESDFSNEVTWTSRLAAPTGLKLTAVVETSARVSGPWTNISQV